MGARLRLAADEADQPPCHRPRWRAISMATQLMETRAHPPVPFAVCPAGVADTDAEPNDHHAAALADLRGDAECPLTVRCYIPFHNAEAVAARTPPTPRRRRSSTPGTGVAPTW